MNLLGWFVGAKKIDIKIQSFSVGQIYKMNVAKYSHVTKPYYVEIIEVGEDFIVTNIPGEHSLKISSGVHNNWDYHIPRMEYIGEKEEFGHLLLNQNLKHKWRL